MSNEDIKELKKALKDQKKKINHSKQGAMQFLQESGIATQKGNIKKAFRSAK